MRTVSIAAVSFAVSVIVADPAAAQYSRVATPFHNAGHSFFERNGLGFGFNLAGANNLPSDDSGSGVVGLNPAGGLAPGGNLFFGQGGFGGAQPPFGGFNPGAGARGGFRVQGDNVGLNFNFAAAQGASSTMTSQTPIVVIPNGGTGSVSDTSQSPFVTGVIPIVGRGGVVPVPYRPVQPRLISPLRQKLSRMAYERQALDDLARRYGKDATAATRDTGRSGRDGPSAASSATRGDLSVAEIRRSRAAKQDAQQTEALKLLERARGAEDAGKPGVAKIYLEMALRRASGELQDRIAAKLKELGGGYE